MDAAAAAFSGTEGDAESFRPMHTLMERQFYRLAYWRVAADEINYRRFFNINELAGVRMENRALFEKSHALVGRMIAEGRLDGLRLDHIDGLFDPAAYCRHLQSFASAQRPGGTPDQVPFYIVVEKIVAHHEALRPNWPIAGTTGYEFANLANSLFVDPAGAEGCARAYADFAGPVPPLDEAVLAAKDVVVDTMLASELAVLADELDRISERHWNTRDFARRRLREALKAVVRQFPVYRTYVSGRGVSAEDRRDLDWAVGRAKRAWHGADREILDFVHEALTGDLARRGPPFRRADVLRFAMHFQQYTGPVMAKSLEDTAFYRYHRLIALNEVGGDPRQFGVSVAAFHHANRERARHWPHSMLATSTHDTKRGEDARLRIDVISEIPEEWGRRAARWSELNRALRREVDGAPAPSRNDEYLLHQTLLGAWPADFIANAPDGDALSRFAGRVQQFLLKAMREAKLESSWENPNQAYEEAALAFARELLERSPNPFLADFSDFAARAARFAMLSGISQTVLRLTAPGVPDTYQGAEAWNYSLVDPDNRAPVDFAGLQRLAGRAQNDAPTEAMARWTDGSLKLRLTATLLNLRRAFTELFLGGSYEPLRAEGPRADHLVAFTRADRGGSVAVIAGRLFVRLLGWESERYDGGVWRETTLAWPQELRGAWRDALSGTRMAIDGERAAVEALLAHLPAAVLVRERT
jgi:(1->4)-alpha-D-glucan 1-alpha-D-glucosylmutase